MIETRFIDDEFQIIRNNEGFSILTHTKPYEIKERDVRDEKKEKIVKVLRAFLKNHIKLVLDVCYDKKVVSDFISNIDSFQAVMNMAVHAAETAKSCDHSIHYNDLIVLEQQVYDLSDVFSAYHKVIDSSRYKNEHDFAGLFDDYCDDFYKKINKIMYSDSNFHNGAFNILTGVMNDGEFNEFKI